MSRILTQKDLERLPHKQQVQVAIYAAELVTDLVEAQFRPLADKCIEVTKKWLKGEASTEECREIAKTSESAAWALDRAFQASWASGAAEAAAWAIWTAKTARAGTGAAGWAENAVNYTVRATNKQETIDKIYIYYDNLLNIDKYAEEAFLGE